MGINENIIKVEEKWLKKLYAHSFKLFENKYLPSHNHEHHLRVWHNAKKIIEALSEKSNLLSPEIIETIFIACFFHDSGLTVTLDEKHGKAGCELCLTFFKQQQLDLPHGIQEILQAIEYHDDKKYLSESFAPEDFRNIVAIADDMDAFGAIGVFRYAEIYLLRGIDVNLLAEKVLPNLNTRFKHIEKIYFEYPSLIANVRLQYEYTKSFYNLLNFNELKNEQAKIIQIINYEIITQKKQAGKVWENCYKTMRSPYCKEFFNKIVAESNTTQNTEIEIHTEHQKSILIFDAREINRFAIFLLIGLFTIIYLPIAYIFGFDKSFRESESALMHLLFYLVPIIIVHEGLHGLTWAVACKSIRNIKFGFNTKIMAPYTHCNIPLSKEWYIAGGLAPLVMMGIIPALVSVAYENIYWFTLALFCIFTSGGDILSCWRLMRIKGKFKVQDHPEMLGFIIET